ncbi:RNA polymerase sigma factor [Streptomyces cyaneofuscatus]|uniref:RNA polymerase sigma factor n=1 Tax=Streptomyces cyaneofuscatus TaxID=66883 RepID=UPI0033E05C0F
MRKGIGYGPQPRSGQGGRARIGPQRAATCGSSLRHLIDSAIAALPARQRSFLLLMATGLHATEIGDYLGVAVNTVHVHLHRTRARLQKALDAEGRVT